MDYKLLYGFIFSPIFLILIYMSYLHISHSDNPNTSLKKTKETMQHQNTQNFQQISANDFKKELDRGESILIDIRRKEEQLQYWVISQDQLHIVFWEEDFAENIQKLDKDKDYLIYCWHWQRSAIAREFMKEQGFQSVKDLEWGIDAWKY